MDHLARGDQRPGSSGWVGLGRLCLAALTLAAIALLIHAYDRPVRQVYLILNGETQTIATRVPTVSAFLDYLNLRLDPIDLLWPDPQTPLTEGATVRVQRAHRVWVDAGGVQRVVLTHDPDPLAVLRAAGYSVSSADVVIVDGRPLGQAVATGDRSDRTVSSRGPRPVTQGTVPQKVELRRAVSFQVTDGGVVSSLYTTAKTVGQALLETGIRLYLGDTIAPDLGESVSSGTRVYIQRAIPMEIRADGRTRKTRTRAATVAEALAAEGVALVGQDYCEPELDTPVSDGLVIKVVRVREEAFTEQEPIPYQTTWGPEPLLEIDRQEVQREGEDGDNRRRVRLTYHDGVEVARQTSEWWMAKEPVDKRLVYGTKIVVREIPTPDGPIQYWRKVPMLATSYTAATSGKERDHPEYGITRLGWQARRGIVAVDPRVVNMGSRVYVPGYGIGDVADTGGDILGRHIDLCYDEGHLVFWWSWVDVYLLAPGPPPELITYLLPDWPQE